MKKQFLFLFLLAIASNFLFADPVDVNYATKIAKNFYLQSLKSEGLQDVNLTLARAEISVSGSVSDNTDSQEIPVYYIFNINQSEGFVIVSADNDVTPCLGTRLQKVIQAITFRRRFRNCLKNIKARSCMLLQTRLKLMRK
jgi:hypothetical protein